MKAILRSAGLIALACSTFGCAKFQASRRADFTPFAEHTIESVASLDADLSGERRVLTVEYLRDRSDIYERMGPLVEHLHNVQRQMVEYSIFVGRLSKKGKSEAQQIRELADYIENLREMVGDVGPERERLSSAEAAEILEEVRSQEHILDALLAAQPVVNHVGSLATRAVKDIREFLLTLETAVNASIEADFKDLFRYDAATRSQRVQILLALEEVYRYREGDAEAISRVLESGVIPPPHIEDFDLDDSALDVTVEDYLLDRLDRLARAAEVLQPELDRYVAIQAEWDAMRQAYDLDLRKTWLVIFQWTRAHQRMASGVVDPAEWFDIEDTPELLFELAKRAI
jgi:hypothetical protein